MNLIHRFSVGFLMFFGVFLLYFNFCLAFNINPFPGFLIPSQVNNWNDGYYFGFSSIMQAINDFPNQTYIYYQPNGTTGEIEQALGFSFGMGNILEDFMNSMGSIAKIFGDMDAFVSTGDIFAFFRMIFDIFTAPLQAIFYFLKLTIELVWLLLNLIGYFTKIISGYYNIPMPSSIGLDELGSGELINLYVDNTGGIGTTIVNA